MLFVNLIYRHFDILMSQYGQANKCNASWGCSARTENPVTPQTHLIPWIPLRQHNPTETSKHTQTEPDSVRGCLGVSVCVCWLLFSFVDFLSSLEMSGGVWGMFAGWVYGYLSDIHGNLWCSDRSDSPGREFWPKCGLFFFIVEPSCVQAWWDRLDCSIDLGQL
jgi:hypothetical protein